MYIYIYIYIFVSFYDISYADVEHETKFANSCFRVYTYMYVCVCMQISIELILSMCIHCHSHCCYVSYRCYIRL